MPFVSPKYVVLNRLIPYVFIKKIMLCTIMEEKFLCLETKPKNDTLYLITPQVFHRSDRYS
jgi:hypothetical protein